VQAEVHLPCPDLRQLIKCVMCVSYMSKADSLQDCEVELNTKRWLLRSWQCIMYWT
jgi:hypothetical protein